MEDFCSLNDFESLVEKPTCSKIHENPTSIDLILTNSYFQHSNVFQTGISKSYLLIVIQLTLDFNKKVIKIVAYQDYKKIDNDKFRVLAISPLANLVYVTVKKQYLKYLIKYIQKYFQRD